jgi:hypothetical protein
MYGGKLDNKFNWFCIVFILRMLFIVSLTLEFSCQNCWLRTSRSSVWPKASQELKLGDRRAICPPDIQEVSAPFDTLEDADDATTVTRYFNAGVFVSKLLASDGPLFRLAQSISRAETW